METLPESPLIRAEQRATLREHFTYGQAMGVLVAAVTIIAAVVVSLGSEVKGVAFGHGPSITEA